MSSSKKKANAPDILIGVFLLAAIPLVTYALLPPPESAAPEGSGPAADPKVLPLTAEELNELKDEYARMYKTNARLFIQRAADSRSPEREQGWARQVLLRVRKGFADLQVRVKASKRLAGALPEIEGYLRDIDADLKALPPAPPGRPAAPPAGASPAPAPPK